MATKIGIIGAGGVGRAIRLALAGESVLLADRSAEKAQEVARAASDGAPGEVRAVPTEDGLGGRSSCWRSGIRAR